MSIRPSIRLSNRWFVCPSVRRSVRWSVRPWARVEKCENAHFCPCPPVCNWYWQCIRPCSLMQDVYDRRWIAIMSSESVIRRRTGIYWKRTIWMGLPSLHTKAIFMFQFWREHHFHKDGDATPGGSSLCSIPDNGVEIINVADWDKRRQLRVA